MPSTSQRGGILSGILKATMGSTRLAFFLIMDLLVRPSIQENSIIRFHVQYGRPIQIPLTDDGIVLLAVSDMWPVRKLFDIDAIPLETELKAQQSKNNTRINLEPFWEVRARSNRILK